MYAAPPILKTAFTGSTASIRRMVMENDRTTLSEVYARAYLLITSPAFETLGTDDPASGVRRRSQPLQAPHTRYTRCLRVHLPSVHPLIRRLRASLGPHRE